LTYWAGRHRILLKYRHIIQISRYFKKYWNIGIAKEISILLLIYRKVFGNIVIVINNKISDVAQS
jgi:hypothetical protein